LAPTVLIVDDSRNIREYCRRELEKEGYRILLACDGREAMQICADDPPSAVVLDLHLPILDGREIVRRLQTLHAGTPVIVHSSQMPEPEFFDGPELPVRDWVRKSGDLTLLKSAVANALASNSPADRELRSEETQESPAERSDR
jgi:DNA-binding response OmpR family regulator